MTEKAAENVPHGGYNFYSQSEATPSDFFSRIANFLLVWGRGGTAGYATARKTICKRNVKNRRMPTQAHDYAPANLLIASESIN